MGDAIAFWKDVCLLPRVKAWLDRDVSHGVIFDDVGDTLSKIACYDVLFLKICRAVPSNVLVRERYLFGVTILHHADMETFQSFSTSSVGRISCTQGQRLSNEECPAFSHVGKYRTCGLSPV